MCEPTTILAATAAVLGGVSAYQGAQASKAAFKRNAEYDEKRVTDTMNRGSEEIFAQRLKQAQVRGTQTASLAARGISLASGSAFNLLQDTDYISDLDVSTLASNTERDAWALRERAGANRAAANAINPGLAAATSLLGGAAKTYAYGKEAKLFGGGAPKYKTFDTQPGTGYD